MTERPLHSSKMKSCKKAKVNVGNIERGSFSVLLYYHDAFDRNLNNFLENEIS